MMEREPTGGSLVRSVVLIWRCSDRSLEPLWSLLARCLTVVWAGNTIMVFTFLQLGLVKRYLGP